MKGFIKITAEPAEGGNVTRTEVQLQDIGFADKTCMLNVFLKGLHISPQKPSCILRLSGMALSGLKNRGRIAMKELNERAALNYKLRRCIEHGAPGRMARQRMRYRHSKAAYRRSITNMAIDAALIGASLTGCMVAVAYLICVAVV